MIKQFLFSFITIALSFIVIQAQAQPATNNMYDYQCVYRLVYQPDSTNKNSRDSADMLLLLNKDNSLFANMNILLRDTLSYYRYKNNINPIISDKDRLSFRTRNNARFRYYISKNENGKILMNDWGNGFDFTFHRYEEDRNIFEWELSDETDTINTIPCQKAICYFGKRHWTAWFAPSIPISDGPYKFCGLPGLIIKILDNKNYWSFTLVKMLNKSFSYHFYSSGPLSYALKNTTKDAFLKARRDYIDNRFLLQKQSGVTFTQGDEAGRKMDKEMAKTDNNWIEIFP